MKRPLCCVCAAFVAIVFLYLEWNPAPQTIYDHPEGSRIALCGEVCRKEWQGSTLVLYLKNISGSAQACKVMCYVEPDDLAEEPRLGSTAAVEGEVSYLEQARNPGGFDAKSHYQILGIDFRLYKARVCAVGSGYSGYHETLYRIRRYFENVFDRVLSAKDASVMKAMILGAKSGLDAESRQLFQRSGIAHIFAISGVKMLSLVSPYPLKKPVNWAFMRLHIAESYIISEGFSRRISSHCPSWDRGDKSLENNLAKVSIISQKLYCSAKEK